MERKRFFFFLLAGLGLKKKSLCQNTAALPHVNEPVMTSPPELVRMSPEEIY